MNTRDIYDGTIPAETFEVERIVLLPIMPKFESCIISTGRVDKYSTIVVAQNHYSVPNTLVGKTVDIRIYTDKIVVYHGGTIVSRHDRNFKEHEWQIDICHYLRTLKRKPGNHFTFPPIRVMGEISNSFF
ncbi:MAG: Mu transposase domain-containing protein [Lachnospiraceae bacterium]